MNRRRFLKLATLGSMGLAGCQSSESKSPTAETPSLTSTISETTTATDTTQPATTETTTPSEKLPSEFVRRDGTQFTIGGRQFLFSGVNTCCLADGYTSRERVNDLLSNLPSLNVDVLRLPIRAASEKSNCGTFVDDCSVSFQPAPGEYHEAAFKHLDYIVAEAGRRGIRLIIPLVNYWGSNEGMHTYVEWSDTAETRNDFYTDDRAQKLYRDFIEHLLTRRNSITGRVYRDDPTIMMWELANEPRSSPNLSAFIDWVETTATHINQVGAKQLVSTGSDIYEKSAYVKIHQADGIDACSIHYWPQNWDHDANPVSYAKQYLGSRARLGTDKVGKPVYLGEYGWFVNLRDKNTEQQLRRRAELFRKWHDIIFQTDIRGALAWDLMGDNRLEYHNSPGNGRTVSFACPEHRVCSPLVQFANKIDTRSSVQ